MLFLYFNPPKYLFRLFFEYKHFFLEFTGPGHHFESDSDIETIDEKNAESNCESLGKYIIIYFFEKVSKVS